MKCAFPYSNSTSDLLGGPSAFWCGMFSSVSSAFWCFLFSPPGLCVTCLFPWRHIMLALWYIGPLSLNSAVGRAQVLEGDLFSTFSTQERFLSAMWGSTILSTSSLQVALPFSACQPLSWSVDGVVFPRDTCSCSNASSWICSRQLLCTRFSATLMALHAFWRPHGEI